jgi:hypothetical protein
MGIRTTNRKPSRKPKVWVKPQLTYRVKAAIIRNSAETRLLREACATLEANKLLSPELKEWWMTHKNSGGTSNSR